MSYVSRFLFEDTVVESILSSGAELSVADEVLAGEDISDQFI